MASVDKEHMIREFEDLFISRALPIFCTQVQNMYARAKSNNKYHYNLLKEFQDELRGTASWKDEVKNEKYLALVTARMDVDIRLLFGNILELQVGILKNQGYKMVHETPDMPTFVHNVYLNIARELFINPFILYDDVDVRQSQQNIEDLKKIVRRAIKLCFCAIKADIEPIPPPVVPSVPSIPSAPSSHDGTIEEIEDEVDEVNEVEDAQEPEEPQEEESLSPTTIEPVETVEAPPEEEQEEDDKEMMTPSQPDVLPSSSVKTVQTVPVKIKATPRHKNIKKCLVRRHKVPLLRSSSGFESGTED